jgi:Asp-tRNA(Asn)/Glu-tRNA(Gln) amidotransferase C subunit
MEAQQFKNTILKSIDDLDLTNELIERVSYNTIDIDHICNLCNTSRIEYLEACLEEMDTDQLKAFEKTFEKIYERQAKREEEDYHNHKDYKSTMQHLDKIFRI